MGRERIIRNLVLNAVMIFTTILNSCESGIYSDEPIAEEVRLTFATGELATKSEDPDEDKVTDISLMIFDDYGALEYAWWLSGQSLAGALSDGVSFKMIPGKTYNIFGCVNFGYRTLVKTMDELSDIRYHLTRPDDYRSGIPMSISMEDVSIESGEQSLVIPMKRMMAKISLKIDRGRLSDNVSMNIVGARIKNCPKVISVFRENKVTDRSDCFTSGFSKLDFETDPLNYSDSQGLSREISLYMLENMQGNWPDEAIQEGDPRLLVSSYIELDIEYLSDDKASLDTPVQYRFLIGESHSDHNVERNCHYRITVSPQDDGLSKDGWSVDKSGLCTFIKQIRLSDSEIAFEYEGQSYLLEASIEPEDASSTSLVWLSDNPRVASVSDTGLVTATGEGECTITCQSRDGGGARTNCKVKSKFKDYYFILHPGEYIVGNIGDKIHVWCEVFPPNTPFDIGYEELEYDKSRGIYDYVPDDDGHGVTLTLLKSGRGILYMSAGYPINDSKLIVVEVNQR